MTRPIPIAAVAAALATLAGAPPALAAWTWPLQGEVITQFRNGDNPYASGQHRGVDIAGDPGAPVVAAVGGEVRFAGTAGSSGLTVGVRSEDGRYDTSYLHLSSIAVREGQRVAAGEPVGAVGTTGVRSTDRPHLHFGVRDAGSRHAYHDPLSFLPPSPIPRQQPRDTPSPSPMPVPLAPNPAPTPIQAPAVRGAPEPRRAPRPRGLPNRRPEPLPRSRPSPRAAPSPREEPSPAPTPRTVPHPGTSTTPGAVPARRGAPTPNAVRAPHEVNARIGNRAPGRLAPASREPHPDRRSSMTPGAPEAAPRSGDRADGDRADGGPDLGWVIACVGLLLAAGLLGLSEDGRRGAATGERRSGNPLSASRLSAFLRPRLGRR